MIVLLLFLCCICAIYLFQLLEVNQHQCVYKCMDKIKIMNMTEHSYFSVINHDNLKEPISLKTEIQNKDMPLTKENTQDDWKRAYVEKQGRNVAPETQEHKGRR